MTPAEYALPVTRKDDLSLDLFIRGRDPLTGAKTVLNMTGWSLESKFTDSAGTEYTGTATFTDITQGAVNIFLSRTVTTTIPLGNGVWYLALINPAGHKLTYVDGPWMPRDRGGPR